MKVASNQKYKTLGQLDRGSQEKWLIRGEPLAPPYEAMYDAARRFAELAGEHPNDLSVAASALQVHAPNPNMSPFELVSVTKGSLLFRVLAEGALKACNCEY